MARFGYGQKLVGYDGVNKFGRNPNIGPSVEEALWQGGGDYTGFDATAAQRIEAFSSSSADTGNLRLLGLDENWDPQEETITLEGTDPVLTANTFIRCSEARYLDPVTNAGLITARQNITTANVFLVMPIGYSTTMMATYTIPNGFQGHILSWNGAFSSSANPNADAALRLMAREPGEGFFVIEQLQINANQPFFQREFHALSDGPYPEKTDIKIMADSNTINTAIGGGFAVMLEPVEIEE
jgi:hypothetical protein